MEAGTIWRFAPEEAYAAINSSWKVCKCHAANMPRGAMDTLNKFLLSSLTHMHTHTHNVINEHGTQSKDISLIYRFYILAIPTTHVVPYNVSMLSVLFCCCSPLGREVCPTREQQTDYTDYSTGFLNKTKLQVTQPFPI